MKKVDTFYTVAMFLKTQRKIFQNSARDHTQKLAKKHTPNHHSIHQHSIVRDRDRTTGFLICHRDGLSSPETAREKGADQTDQDCGNKSFFKSVVVQHCF